MIHRTYKYRIYPSLSQRITLQHILDVTRHWYNMCLEARKLAYGLEGRSLSKYDQLRNVKHYKRTFPQAKSIHSHILQVTTTDLDKAFQAFFRRVKLGETPGYPRFKGYMRWDSFGFKEYGNGFRLEGRKLKVSGVGRISVRWHRELLGTVKTCRLVRKADKWYVCLSVEIPKPDPLPKTGQEVGVDMGITAMLTTSDGHKVENPQFYRQSQRQLRIRQRRLTRAKKGSNNRKKRSLEVQRWQEHTANQRRDYINKLVDDLIQRYDVIAIEDLQITNMVCNKHLSKSILDSGWGFFRQRLYDKAAEAGRLVIEVNPAYTSQDCSNCGQRHQLKLSDRWLTCKCGLSLDRDHNAAINILKRTRQDVSVKQNVDGCVKRVSEAVGL